MGWVTKDLAEEFRTDDAADGVYGALAALKRAVVPATYLNFLTELAEFCTDERIRHGNENPNA